MARQVYKNHVRYFAPHHFVFYPIIILILAICIKNYSLHQADSNQWLMMASLSIMTGALSFMLRQHYALNNQDRIVRLEMRLRYYQLCQKRFDPIEKQLNFKQIAALRFAGDGELLALIDKTVAENLAPDAIKKQVTDWQQDHMRV